MAQCSQDWVARTVRRWIVTLYVMSWAGVFVACGGTSSNNTNTNQNNTNTNQNNANANQNNANANQNNANTNQNNANTNQNKKPPPTIPGELEPKSWGELKLEARSYALHKELLDDADLQMILMGKDLWVGGKKGLFRWANGKFEQIDKVRVTALAVWELKKGQPALLVGRENRIDLWLNHTIAPSALSSILEKGEKLQVMVARGKTDLWIGTDKTLWRWQNEDTPIQQFKQIKGVKSLYVYDGSPELILHTNDDKIIGLRNNKGSWELRSLEREVKDTTLEDVLPWKNGEFWGMAKGKLFFRKRTEKNVAWWPFRLKPNKDKDFEWSVRRMALDFKAGTVWLWVRNGILRIDEAEARLLRWKEKLEKVVLFRIGKDEGLWISDGKVLWRIGQDGPVTTYQKDVKPFVQQSCLKCHKQGGSADFYLLTTYDEVRSGVNDMIRRIEEKGSPMPPPPNKLVGGDAETLRRWIQGGYRQ